MTRVCGAESFPQELGDELVRAGRGGPVRQPRCPDGATCGHDPVAELADEARLSHPGRRHEQHSLGPLRRFPPHLLEEMQLPVPADSGGDEPVESRLAGWDGPSTEHTPGRDPAGLALEPERARRLRDEGVTDSQRGIRPEQAAPGSAAAWSRAATLTASPVSRHDPGSPGGRTTTTSPVFTPTRTRRASRSSRSSAAIADTASTMARAATPPARRRRPWRDGRRTRRQRRRR